MTHNRYSKTLITGGSRSGKSTYALTLADYFERKVFLATARALDEEMKARIAKHQQERDHTYHTIEEPIDLAKTIDSTGRSQDVILVDCLTVWLGNLQLELSPETMQTKIEALLEILEKPPCHLIFVTNEVGMGIVPEHKLARDFRDQAGLLNQRMANLVDRVVLVVSGIPLEIKNNLKQGSMP